MILEAIITTEAADGSMHVAPMGPHVSEDLTLWKLKPFQTSTTFKNMFATHRCVVNVVDDALLLAQAVTGQANSVSSRFVGETGYVLDAACHWYGLKMVSWDVSLPRAVADCVIHARGVEKPFFGWNRAKHAVVELAILTSRLSLMAHTEVDTEVARLRILVEKTAGDREHEAFGLLVDHIEKYRNENSGTQNIP